MREINYEQLLANYREMINVLEYDSMRSAGKSKINAGTLADLHSLAERYQKLVNSQQPSVKKETK